MHVQYLLLSLPKQRLPIRLQAAECLLIRSSGLLSRQHHLREWHGSMVMSSRQLLTSPQAAVGSSIAHSPQQQQAAASHIAHPPKQQ